MNLSGVYKITIELSADHDFTDNLKILEVLSLIELSGVNVEVEIRDSRKINVMVRRTDDLLKLMDYICRSAFIKRVYCTDRGLELRLGKGYTINRLPLRRLDTASAPLEASVARLLINLAKIDCESVVLDPFCGSGGILAEARMCGANVLCGDLVYKYVKVARQNLDMLSDFFVADAGGSIPLRETCVDSIVADPPYSRLSVTDEDIDVLYLNFLKESYRILKRGGRVVMSTICSLPVEEYGEEVGLEVITVGFQYVNSTLVRKIVVFQKM